MTASIHDLKLLLISSWTDLVTVVPKSLECRTPSPEILPIFIRFSLIFFFFLHKKSRKARPVIVDKLTVSKPVNKFPASYTTHRLTTAFTKAHISPSFQPHCSSPKPDITFQRIHSAVCLCIHFIIYTTVNTRDNRSTVVKVLCYKSEGRWFDPSWCHWNFPLT